MFFNIIEAKFHQKPHLLDEKQQFIKVSDIPWIIKNPSNWPDYNRRCEIGTKCVFLAHGVIATSDWQYRVQRLAISRRAIDVLYNREQYYLFFNRCP